jgi:Tol biopolymer transport system component
VSFDDSGLSSGPSVSADGRHVAFTSSARDLVPDDTNGATDDVFVWDRDTSTMLRITAGDRGSMASSISDDGRYVTFSSFATNLVPGDDNGELDVFRWDRTTGTTVRITDGNGYSASSSISADGRLVAFTSAATDLVAGDTSDTNGKPDVFLWNADSGTTTRITDSAAGSHEPSLSADGSVVTFHAFASHDVPEDTNDRWDVFVWDVDTASTTRITDGNEDSLHPTISGDGRYVAFQSWATNLIGDHNYAGLFLWDAQTGVTSQIANGGTIPVISGDGRHVVFNRHGERAIDVHVWDATTGATTNITEGIADSDRGSPSADGSVIAFASDAFDLVPGDAGWTQDVFVWQRDG